MAEYKDNSPPPPPPLFLHLCEGGRKYVCLILDVKCLLSSNCLIFIIIPFSFLAMAMAVQFRAARETLRPAEGGTTRQISTLALGKCSAVKCSTV